LTVPNSPLIVFVGPTAVGKTEVALQLADRLEGEIVSADSRLFYRGMDIGTAKPSPAERKRVPHHLIDVADPDQTWGLAVFQEAAREAIAGIHARLRIPFLVGGTGQYVRAVTEGWSPPGVKADERLRSVLEKMAAARGSSWLHARLMAIDPASAQAIDARNVRRTIRAWEVILLTGRRFSEQRTRMDSPYALRLIGLTRPRPELYARIDERIEAMFANGLLDEVRGLLAQGYSADLPSMSGIGYRECAAVLRGEMSLDEARTQMKRLTRVFVRRQANWFKANDPAIRWFDADRTQVAEIEAFIRGWLAGP
jgi:tRNA dimethylallyltransferase